MTHTVAPGGEARGPARIAVVGAGPAGLYAVTELVESGHPVKIDVFERLPSPFGLVRYGVAPDNQKIKSVARVLGAPFTAHSATVRFLGNVSVGRDISRHEALETIIAASLPHAADAFDETVAALEEVHRNREALQSAVARSEGLPPQS